jgi:glycosyltransferase involved in cell wall biosynthesis
MITYNHEKYIAEAIEGVLMQKTDFPIELIIGEDCSTDNTRDICLEYQRKYPDIIKLLLPEKNQGMMQNAFNTLKACTGKYIASCEGDDYWTDPYKLQKQVDFLEANADFSICFHAVKIKKELENIIVDDYITPQVSDVTDIYRLAQGNYIHTPSVVFRKKESVLQSFVGLGDLRVGDYVLHILNAQYGKIKKIPDVMAVYRAGVGVWNVNDNRYRLEIWANMLDKLICLFAEDEKLTHILKQQYKYFLFALYNLYKREKDVDKAQSIFFTACVNYPDVILDEYEEISRNLQMIKHRKFYRFSNLLHRLFKF